MPSQKKKLKKSKVDSTPVAVPVQIKAEPLDVKPLSAYIDDRVELIRQAFMCLKPKDIKCLVPDFLQGKSVEYLQEQCLDEVLGISTKRLHSIINCSKCPTDTESSSDDDIQGITEHISLDEISSESDVDTKQNQNAKNSKLKEVKSKRHKNADSSTNDKVEKNGDKKHEKEMTVLELLELQARARAIRSQLALEPVTKIELDSDQEADNESDNTSEIRPSKTSKTKENFNAADSCNSESSRHSPAKKQTKRITLKRNFRIRQVGDEDVTEGTTKQLTPGPADGARRSRSKSNEKPVVTQLEPVANNTLNKERDSSPEVIPVIPSPETLCISSDSEDEKLQKKKSNIFVDNIAELDRLNARTEAPETKRPTENENEEPEEGEISDEEKLAQECPVDEQKESPAIDATSATILEHDEELDYEVKEISDSEKEKSDHSKDSIQVDSGKKAEDSKVDSSTETSDSSDSEAESVSSGTDEHVDKPKPLNDEDECLDIVEIHDSSDETLLDQKMAEDDREKSWNSRWLESNRVAKVMAASRLGNKVRDKLKKDKKKKQEQEQEEKIEEPPAPVVEPPTVSTAEVGSVEHYNELNVKSTEQAATSGENTQKEVNE